VEDPRFRAEFHAALDVVAPPAPWLSGTVREELRRRRSVTEPHGRPRVGFTVLNPTAQKLVAAALLLVVAATVAAAAIAFYNHAHVVPVLPHTGPVTRQCSLAGVHMVDPKVGWNGTSRTTDGGKTWHDVSPPTVQGSIKGPGGTCTLGADHAWALTSTGTDLYQPTHLALLSTADGGQSWQPVSAIAVPYAVSWKINFSAEFDFLDEKHGWLLMEYATEPMQRKLYATSDGGVHWSVVSRAPDLGLGDVTSGCSESGIMFATLMRGWLTWNCTSGYGDREPGPGPVIAFTNDGGATWKPLGLPSYPTGGDWICGAPPPIFSGDRGVFELSCAGRGHPGQDVIYSTADVGHTWVAHQLANFASVDFIDGNTGYYFWQAGPDGSSNTLYRTTDAGATWAVVATGLFPGQTVGSVTFLSATTGFADTGGPAPWWTYDGGKTWSLPAPYHSVGNTVCPIFSDPGAGPLPQSIQMVSPTVGWAAGGRRTVDGGAHWTDVSPPAPTGRSSGYGEFFLDATHAWVVDAVGSSTACADHFVIYSTSDGGASWREQAPVRFRLANRNAVLTGMLRPYIDFIDPDHGWVVVQPGYISGPRDGDLYGTSDGGRHWTLVSAEVGSTGTGCSSVGGVEFASTTNGFIEGSCVDQTNTSQGRLLATTDGGVTWSIRDLGLDTCCGPLLPLFINTSFGWLTSSDNVVVVTTDGGVTWMRLNLPRFTYYTCQGKFGPTTCSTEFIEAATFLSPNQGWLVVAEFAQNGSPLKIRIEQTLDGGRSWAVLYSESVASDGDMSSRVTFVDANNGFWWFNSHLFRTTDGGHTWTAAQITYTPN